MSRVERKKRRKALACLGSVVVVACATAAATGSITWGTVIASLGSIAISGWLLIHAEHAPIDSAEVNDEATMSEPDLRSGKANLQRGLETVGGRLRVLSTKLVFEPHALNVQAASMSVNLVDVTEVRKTSTRFLGKLSLVPNGLVVATAETDYVFTVFNRRKWIADIEAARSRIKKAGSL